MPRWADRAGLLVAACLVAGAAASADARSLYRGTMLNGSRISFVLGSDHRVRGLDIPAMQLLCSDSSDRHARIFVAEQGEPGIPVSAGGHFSGTFRLHASGISGTAVMRGAFAADRVTGSVRARVTTGGVSCDSGSAQFTARRVGGGSAPPSTGTASVRTALRSGTRRLGAALAALASLGAPADFTRAGAAIEAAAVKARRAVLTSRAPTRSTRLARAKAAAGFRDYARAGAQLVLVGRFMATDDPRGDAAIAAATKQLGSGRRLLVAAGRLVGLTVKLPGG